ncbi:MAG TPA: hypothetical protein VHE08_06695 [Solirubrobacterales bacterium]|nr:hypothetical protein [Solirubrobacterales bacterium]
MIEPERPSPTAKTPGRLVSSGIAGRPPRPVSASRWATSTASPVSRKPSSSLARAPSSHSVQGSAPMKTKRPPRSISRRSRPRLSSITIPVSARSPRVSRTSVWRRTSMFSIASICSTR